MNLQNSPSHELKGKVATATVLTNPRRVNIASIQTSYLIKEVGLELNRNELEDLIDDLKKLQRNVK